ncbi:MAG: hypothetical protein ABJN69_12225 [Hellea sp.]
MTIFRLAFLTAIIFLIACSPKKKSAPVITEETISVIDQVTASIKEDKATVIGFFVKPQRSTSCEKMYVEISIFDTQAKLWRRAVEFEIVKNSKQAIGGPSMDDQLFLASLNVLEEVAITGMGCQPYQEKMSRNYQIYATFKPEYGKINIIGSIEQNILAKGVNIYDFKANTEAAKTLITAENPALENDVVPVNLNVQLWKKFQGAELTPAEIVADKMGAKTFILYQLDLRNRVKSVENLSEVFLNDAAKGTYKMSDTIRARKLSLELLDSQREDVYRFYDMLAAGTSISQAALYTELLSTKRGITLDYELGRISGTRQSLGLAQYDQRIKELENSRQLKGMKTKSRIAEVKTRGALRADVTQTEEQYLKVMYPFSKLRSVKSREKQVELTKAYLDALETLETFDVKRHVDRSQLSEINANIYVLSHKEMMEAKRDYLMDLAQRAHEEDFLMSRNYHRFKQNYVTAKEDIDRLNVVLFSSF